MSQHDLVIANQSFPATRTDLNAAILAVASNSSGATEPTTTYANQWWYETDTNILKIRNEANDDWVNVITLDESMTASASDLNLLNTANRGAAGTVLTSDGTDLSWATAGGFAGSTVAVTANTTLTSGQSGNLIRVTATGSKVITLPAVANGLFYVFSSESASEMYIKANGSNTINGSNAGVKLKLAAGASGIISCGTAGTNWSSVGITRNMIVHKSTTFYNNNDANAGNSGDATRVTGTYTTTLGTQILICVGSATPSAPYGAGSNSTNRSAGAPGQSYGEKFISSPASTYAYEICGGGDVSGASTGGFDRTTKAGGITATRGADGTTQGSGNTAARTGGTCSGGTVNFVGGNSSAGVNTTGGGGGAATRAGIGGNGNSSGNVTGGGGTGGNNASTSAAGTAATSKDSGSQAIANSTSETYQAGTLNPNTGAGGGALGSGAGPKTEVNFGSVSFTIADNENLVTGGVRGSTLGGGALKGNGGYVTFVEFI